MLVLSSAMGLYGQFVERKLLSWQQLELFGDYHGTLLSNNFLCMEPDPLPLVTRYGKFGFFKTTSRTCLLTYGKTVIRKLYSLSKYPCGKINTELVRKMLISWAKLIKYSIKTVAKNKQLKQFLY